MTFKINFHIHDITLWHMILNLDIYIYIFFIYTYIFIFLNQYYDMLEVHICIHRQISLSLIKHTEIYILHK